MISNILIIEDEVTNADRLIRLTKILLPDATVIDVLDSIADSVSWLKNNMLPDLILMDIILSDGLSFDIFEKVEITCPVIFTTAYDEYAIRAFKFNSIDYLLKPIQQDELRDSFIKVQKYALTNKVASIEGLIDFLQPKQYRSRFLLPHMDGYKSVLIEDISYFYSEMKITKIRLKDGSIDSVPLSLEEVENQINPKTFFRANRQFIINIDSLASVKNYFSGKLKVFLKVDKQIEILISREKATSFKNWLDY